MQTVDDYIASQTPEIRLRLNTLRQLVKDLVPDATESISYGMPAYKLRGKPLIYFAAFPEHIGLYATPNGHAAFEADFSHYKHGKGSVQFPHNEPLPLALIRRVVEFRKSQII